VTLLAALGLLAAGCAASSQSRSVAESAESAGKPKRKLTRNHFKRDRSGQLTEAQLNQILEAPIDIEEGSRLGVVPVRNDYRLDGEVPLTRVPRRLSESLEETGYFEVATEVGTQWPTTGSIAGLRELAARYRSKYLLLYRHRFVKRSRTNAWGWTYPTIVGLFSMPGKTVEVSGVLEATLFDVRTGTILFTVYERVHDQRKMNIWHNRHKRRAMKRKMLDDGTDALSSKVTDKVGRLVAGG
jgi:hypothetical protein